MSFFSFYSYMGALKNVGWRNMNQRSTNFIAETAIAQQPRYPANFLQARLDKNNLHNWKRKRRLWIFPLGRKYLNDFSPEGEKKNMLILTNVEQMERAISFINFDGLFWGKVEQNSRFMTDFRLWQLFVDMAWMSWCFALFCASEYDNTIRWLKNVTIFTNWFTKCPSNFFQNHNGI